MNSNGTSATNNHTTTSPTGGTPSSSRKALALDLKRSSKVDFTRERSFVQYSRRGGGRSGNVAVTVQQHQAAVAAAAGRAAGKPSLEIYRPPSVRQGSTNSEGTEGSEQPRLNVHAKEFTMAAGSTGGAQHSATRGAVKLAPLQQSFSIGNMLSSAVRVHFQDDPGLSTQQSQSKATKSAVTIATPGSLQRSKSLGAADMASREPGVSREAPELGIFPGEVLTTIRRAVTDPNQLSARSLMALVRQILQRVSESARYAAPAAKLCITIIEKETQETFLESLLNTCTQWYQERDRHLRQGAAAPAVLLPGAPAPSCPRWVAFMTFLNEMYCQLKRRQLQLRTKPQGISPEMLLLGLLYDSCHVCLRPPAVNSLGETECLFFVLTSIGRDLDSEMAMRMPGLMAALRDAFLTAALPGVRKTLLQLIEMRAARWQLPAPAVMYYYPGSSAIK